MDEFMHLSMLDTSIRNQARMRQLEKDIAAMDNHLEAMRQIKKDLVKDYRQLQVTQAEFIRCIDAYQRALQDKL